VPTTIQFTLCACYCHETACCGIKVCNITECAETSVHCYVTGEPTTVPLLPSICIVVFILSVCATVPFFF
jgi:hypothetical protein